MKRWYPIPILMLLGGCGTETSPPAPAEEKSAEWKGELERVPPAKAPPPNLVVAATPAPAPAAAPDPHLPGAVRIQLGERDASLRFHQRLHEYLAFCEEEAIRNVDERRSIFLTTDFIGMIRRARESERLEIDRLKLERDDLAERLRGLEAGGPK